MPNVSMIDGHIDQIKLKDEDIIKALEDYKNSKILQTENGVISIGDILDLINRQKEQINGLIAAQETLQKYISEIKKEDIL